MIGRSKLAILELLAGGKGFLGNRVRGGCRFSELVGKEVECFQHGESGSLGRIWSATATAKGRDTKTIDLLGAKCSFESSSGVEMGGDPQIHAGNTASAWSSHGGEAELVERHNGVKARGGCGADRGCDKKIVGRITDIIKSANP